MPVGAQCVRRIPISWPWNTGPALVARLRDRARSTGPSRSARNSSNALRFVFGPSRRTSPDRTSPSRRASSFLPSGPVSEKPAAKITANFGLRCEHLLERVDRAAGEDDHEVEVAGHVEDRLVARVAEHRLVLGVHRVERGAVLGAPTRRTCASSPCSASPTAPTRRSRAIAFGCRNVSRSTARSASGRPETSSGRRRSGMRGALAGMRAPGGRRP